MKMYNISKKFEFDYGHRVWTQKLNTQFSLDNECVCKHFHGHRATVEVFLSNSILNEQGMVTDFKHLNWFKKFIDEALDHKFLMHIKDPALQHFFPLVNLDKLSRTPYYKTLLKSVYKDQPAYIQQIYEGLILVSFVPTSENLSAWLFKIVNDKMKQIEVECTRIDFNETPKSKSSYECSNY